MMMRPVWIVVLVLAAESAAAQSYPSRPITMINPFPAGGATDILARTLVDHMKGSLGQPIVVENVPGAGGSVGTGRVARAAGDGYTLSFGNWASHVGSGAMYPLQYDLLKDLEPVAYIATSPLWIRSPMHTHVRLNAVPSPERPPVTTTVSGSTELIPLTS